MSVGGRGRKWTDSRGTSRKPRAVWGRWLDMAGLGSASQKLTLKSQGLNE